MRKLLYSIIIILGTSCNSIIEVQVQENAARCDRFIDLIKQGKTTRSQEQDFVEANRKAWWAVNYSMNNVPLPPDLAFVSTTNSVVSK